MPNRLPRAYNMIDLAMSPNNNEMDEALSDKNNKLDEYRNFVGEEKRKSASHFFGLVT